MRRFLYRRPAAHVEISAGRTTDWVCHHRSAPKECMH